MKRLYKLAARLSVPAGMLAMMAGLTLAKPADVQAGPTVGCKNDTPPCTEGNTTDTPPCSSQKGSCSVAPGAPVGTSCGCGFGTLKDKNGVVTRCIAACVSVIPQP